MPILQLAGIWTLLQVIPLVIVFLLYYFFDQKNFFGTEGTWRGIVASGPIGAYLFATWMGFRTFTGLANRFNPTDRFEDLVGSWTLKATSEHDSVATGRCEISTDDGRLKLEGTFEERGRPTVVWNSEFAFVDGNRTFYVYTLDAAQGRFVGYVRLLISRGPAARRRRIMEMHGDWVSVGGSLKRGKIEFSRTA